MSYLYYATTCDLGLAPIRLSNNAAGYSILSPVDEVIKQHDSYLLNTCLSVKLPVGTYGRITNTNELAWVSGIDVSIGYVDPGDCNPILVLLRNTSDTDYHFFRGEPIAQLIVEKYESCVLIPLSSLNG